MEAIRKIVTVRDNTVTVVLPENFNNTDVELIIMPVPAEVPKVEEKKVDYYTKYYGTLKSGLTVDEIDKQLADLRNEWNRDPS